MDNEQIIKDLINALEETWRYIWHQVDKGNCIRSDFKYALNLTNNAIMNAKSKGE